MAQALRRLVARLSPQKPVFGPRCDYARFVLNKVALGFIFLRVLRIFHKAILLRKFGSVGLRSASLEAIAWLNRLIGRISPWRPRSRYRAR
jgi:hypothetical protein